MKTTTLISDLCFGEGPRWHDGRLWFSDMHANQVIAVDDQGVSEVIVSVENQPSGLGWLPDGDLIVVSMTDRRLLRWNGKSLTEHANLANLASFHCNDMVVDQTGRAYVGNFGFDLHAGAQVTSADLICVDPDGSARVVASDIMFPNGTVITPDASTLIVAESFASRLSAFDIDSNGDLSNRRVWAELPEGAVPDGICLDSDGGIWSASPSSNECLRQTEGGEVTHRVSLDRGAFACMLGGADGTTLYILTSGSSDPDVCKSERSGRIETCNAPYPHAGWP
jgi:sugar lactone lactonase YvrE